MPKEPAWEDPGLHPDDDVGHGRLHDAGGRGDDGPVHVYQETFPVGVRHLLLLQHNPENH